MTAVIEHTNTKANQMNMSHETARFNMIEQQIRTWEVLDPAVLQLLHDVPRENFVPQEYVGLAFADIEIPLGANQVMLSPKLEGRMLQALNVTKHDRVLHVGTGSGYFTALLASLAKEVVSVEINANLSLKAAQLLQAHHIQNVTLHVADGVNADASAASYDVIVYTASSPIMPANAKQQLSVGGRMLIILGQAPAMQATLIQRVSETSFNETVLFETSITPLINAPQANQFAF
jgi:protein-L-isoaspartate(D-aspartate) O-methyltransferase